MSIRAGRGGCCVIGTDLVGHPRDCPGAVVYAALWRYPANPRRAWRVFLCEQHRNFDGATDVRPLTDGDQEALRLRRERWAAALRGERWIPPRPLAE